MAVRDHAFRDCFVTLYYIVFFLFLILFCATSALGNDVLISVASDPCDKAWNQELTSMMKGVLSRHLMQAEPPEGSGSKSLQVRSDSDCLSRDGLERKLSTVKQAGFQYWYRLEKSQDGALHLSLKNIARKDDTEFTEFQWTIEAIPLESQGDVSHGEKDAGIDEEKQLHHLRTLLVKSADYIQKQSEIKLRVLGRAIESSERVGKTKGGEFFRKDTLELVTPEKAYQIYSNENPRQKHFLRAALEIIGFLGASTIYYRLDSGNKDDWDLGVDLDNLKGKFVTFDYYIFDDNSWETNLYHATAGASYYILARSNDLNILESFLYTIAASSLWEYGTEFREQVSINDSILTPVGGFAIGEVIYQMGEFFQHSADTKVNKILSIAFGAPSVFHRWIDKNKPKAPKNVDKYGFNTDVWHRFRLWIGHAASTSTDYDGFRSEVEAGANLELVNIHEYGKPGEVCSLYTHGVMHELLFKGAWNSNDWQNSLFYSKTVPVAYYLQHIEKDQKTGHLDGYSLLIGAGTSFEYITNNYTQFRNEEKLAVANILGPTIEANFYRSGFRVRCAADVYPNFAMVSPFSIDEFRRSYKMNNVPGLVFAPRETLYYYAYGLTTSGRLEVNYGNWDLEARIRYHYFDSFESHYRYQEKKTLDVSFIDERFSARVMLAYKLPFDNLKVAFISEKHLGYSELGDLSADVDQTRFLTQLQLEY